MKKIISIVLVLALCIALGVTAMAVDAEPAEEEAEEVMATESLYGEEAVEDVELISAPAEDEAAAEAPAEAGAEEESEEAAETPTEEAAPEEEVTEEPAEEEVTEEATEKEEEEKGSKSQLFVTIMLVALLVLAVGLYFFASKKMKG